MKKSSLFLIAAVLVLAGGGCDRIGQRYGIELKKDTEKESVVVTKDTIDLNSVELFLRSRDDVKPGQADVNNQTLYAKTKSGQIIELVDDVHIANRGLLLPTSYLIYQKDVPSQKYAYFTNSLENSSMVAQTIFVFDKEKRYFVISPITELTNSLNIANFSYSPDHTKIAIVRNETELRQAVYVFDLTQGRVMNLFSVPQKQTVVDPDNSDMRESVSKETKWVDNKKFSVALFDRSQKPSGKNTPVSTVVIDTSKTVNTTNFESFEYSYNLYTDCLFARPINELVSYAMIDAVASKLTPPTEARTVDGNVQMFEGVASSSPFVFFTVPTDFENSMFSGIYEKRTNRFIAPTPLGGVLKINAILSPSGKSLATLSEIGENFVVVQLVDLSTLHTSSQKISTVGLSIYSRLSGVVDTDAIAMISGPNKWTDETHFVLNLYKPVDVQKKARADGKFDVTQPLAKSVTVELK